jgi:hypothetical protein
MTIGMTMIIAIHMAMITIIVGLLMVMNGMDAQNIVHLIIGLQSIAHQKTDLQSIVRLDIDLIARTISKQSLCHIKAGLLYDLTLVYGQSIQSNKGYTSSLFDRISTGDMGIK